MKRKQFNREWEQYIDGFYENYKDDTYINGTSDYIMECWLLGMDVNDSKLDFGRYMRYKKSK
ncbi:hypothetical protein DVV91_17245 [Clostridium botulinum]|uniref:hypothetical protein n=1 Tax=Clostridium botulinum TaxID=1491 RepID=UPI001966D7A4|nr:hypothetical protein [Clostridium botulinum]MBN1076068.1 hypothetical protein [Clostridium botulinum]